MKKITLLMASFALAVSANAQDFASESNVQGISNGGNSTEAVLWDQPSTGANGVVSTFYDDTQSGVAIADDFELTEGSRIETITAYGFQNELTLQDIITGYDLFIFNNDPATNTPDGDYSGGAVLEVFNADPNGGSLTITQDAGYEFIIDVTEANGGDDVVLPAGIYWVSIRPRMATGGVDLTNRWNWFKSDAVGPLSSAHLIDPSDIFGGGYTDWTSYENLGITDYNSTAFLIEGEPALSVNDNALSQISVFPNPASDILNIKVPANVEINSVALYDILGKRASATISNGQINVAGLTSGVYMLNITTTAGTLTEKVIIK
ncbi:hypothetical protein ULMS_11980 [Patiriisocius marinistellae]|uniref:Secretion system C-terminal sorting domain-containing protein n=1 Tax=Patiriisocius marinistellae TaxID=2494560 RepID=A0A5J4FUU8_9FLAO|nr:T9SS type A sorting domain-containing protein [Patiriisocius marinistellae]GEQ85690.1 hypothetical protein ULMS_11980 [Patiriisocius marinistellae]